MKYVSLLSGPKKVNLYTFISHVATLLLSLVIFRGISEGEIGVLNHNVPCDHQSGQSKGPSAITSTDVASRRQEQIKLNQSVNQSVGRSVGWSVGWSVSRWVGGSVGRSVGRSVSQSVNHSINQSINQQTNQSIND